MAKKSEIVAACIFCEGRDLYSLSAVIASAPWPVCKMCAGAGRALMDSGSMRHVLHCLHLVAMEIEQFAVGYAIPEDRAARKWLFRIQRNMSRGAFREVCPCETCLGGGETVVVTDLHEEFGLERETTAETMPLAVLRSMPGHTRVEMADGSTSRAVDEIARRIVENHLATKAPPTGPLAEQAKPKRGGAWSSRTVGNGVEHRYGPIHEGQRAKRDAEVRRYWAAFNKFGPGYLDGDYWITDEDGECHLWPRVQK
jgi:hypothetical protein